MDSVCHYSQCVIMIGGDIVTDDHFSGNYIDGGTDDTEDDDDDDYNDNEFD